MFLYRELVYDYEYVKKKKNCLGRCVVYPVITQTVEKVDLKKVSRGFRPNVGVAQMGEIRIFRAEVIKSSEDFLCSRRPVVGLNS